MAYGPELNVDEYVGGRINVDEVNEILTEAGSVKYRTTAWIACKGSTDYYCTLNALSHERGQAQYKSTAGGITYHEPFGYPISVYPGTLTTNVDTVFFRVHYSGNGPADFSAKEVITDPPPDPPEEPDYVITQADMDALSTAHATMKINDVVATLGDGINTDDVVLCTAGDGYLFYFRSVNFEYINFMSETDYLRFTISTDFKTATYTFAGAGKNGLKLDVDSEVVEPPPDPPEDADYVITQVDMDALSTAHATMKINDVVATLGDSINIDDNVVVIADPGYTFYNNSVYFSGQNSMGEWLYLYFTLSDGGSNASCVLDDSAYSVLNVASEGQTQVSGVNNVYVVDNIKVAEINNERMVGTPPGVYDYGKFILNLINLPLEVGVDYYAEPSTVKLSGFDTEVLCSCLNSDIIAVDMGSITVPLIDDGFTDFKNVVCVLRLPWADSVLIDAGYVVGQTVTIKYFIDCYTGIATINITSTKTGGLIVSKQADIGVNIPFVKTVGDPMVSNSNISVGGDNGVLKPFFEIVKDEYFLKDGLFTIPVIDEKVLQGEVGYLEVEQVNLKVDCSEDEKKNIIDVLKQGVIIQ